MDLSEIMTPEQLQEVRAYSRTGLRCALWDRAIDLLFLGLMAFWAAEPAARFLTRAVPALAANEFLLLTALLLGLTLLHLCVSFPLSFFSGWVLEKRYGLTHLTPLGWLRRWLLQMTLVFALNLFLLTALIFLIRLCGPWWWAAVSVLFFFFSMILGCLMPVLVMPLFYRVERLENDSLLARFQDLTRSTSLKLTGIFRLDLSVETSKANAMLAGLGSTRRVLLGDTLLQNFTEDEITAVFAHEVGHHVHRHMRKMLFGMLFVSFGVFWVTDLALRGWLGGSLAVTPDYAQIPVWTFPFFIFAMTVIGQILEPFQNALSRKFERQADAYAVSHCGAPSALRSAFIKLAIQNKADPFPSRWEVFWLHSHPAIGERIAAIPENPFVLPSRSA